MPLENHRWHIGQLHRDVARSAQNNQQNEGVNPISRLRNSDILRGARHQLHGLRLSLGQLLSYSRIRHLPDNTTLGHILLWGWRFFTVPQLRLRGAFPSIQQADKRNGLPRSHDLLAEPSNKRMERRWHNDALGKEFWNEGAVPLQQTFGKSKDRSSINFRWCKLISSSG